MTKFTAVLIVTALLLPLGSLAQPEDGPRPQRPDRDRAEQRERGDRSGDRFERGDRRGDRDWHSRRKSIDVEQIEEAIATLRAMHPDTKLGWLDRIEKLAEEDPKEAARQLSRFPRLRELMDAREKRPAEFKLQAQQSRVMREVFPLVRQLRIARQQDDQAKIDELRPSLRKHIETLFEVRLKLKEIEIERIRKQLAKAESELEEIKSDADTLIDEKMKELMVGKGPRGPREGDDRQRP
jgi:predicted negative regulator of RcsB-dependent stress response